MNRRGFLRMVGQAAAAGLILPDVAKALIVPERTIFLPPAGGWLNDYAIQLELAMAQLKRDMEFAINRNAFLDGDQWTPEALQAFQRMQCDPLELNRIVRGWSRLR